jgi:hypothetical protein
MTDKAISPLRQRMIEDMTVRRFTAKTQSDYIRSVRNLAVFLGRSPGTATAEDLRRFQVHLTETRIRPPTINLLIIGRYLQLARSIRCGGARTLTNSKKRCLGIAMLKRAIGVGFNLAQCENEIAGNFGGVAHA